MLAVLALLQACGGPTSSSTSGPGGGPVATSRIHMYLTVEASDTDVAVVRANLNDGHMIGGSYRLDGGDFLRACIGGVCRSMADNDSVFTPDYIARFDFQPGIDYVVAFNRQEARDAPDSRVMLPPAFSIVTPVNHQPVSDGDTVQVSWAPTGAPARVALWYEAECTFLSRMHLSIRRQELLHGHAGRRFEWRRPRIRPHRSDRGFRGHQRGFPRHTLHDRPDRAPRARRAGRSGLRGRPGAGHRVAPGQAGLHAALTRRVRSPRLSRAR
jgi:hypothetical protein